MKKTLFAMDSRVPFFLYRVPVSEILDLRQRVLRQGRSIDETRFDGDELPDTWHISLSRTAEGCTLCCATFMRRPLRDIEGWQLRGMATDPSAQGSGLGKILLSHAEMQIASVSNIRRFWCNARVSAVGFYQKMDWQLTDASEFDIPGIGPHRQMTKRLTA